MAEILATVGVAILVAGALYVAVEFFELFFAHRHAPKDPVSGVESAIGKPAIVLGDFFSGTNSKIVGRVLFEGENWNATFVGDSSRPPLTSDRVSIVDIDASKLKVTVK